MDSGKLKKICAVFLSIFMFISMIPSVAFADDEPAEGDPEPAVTKYAIAIDSEIQHGTVAVVDPDPDAVPAGASIRVSLVPDEGYERKTVSVTDANNTPVEWEQESAETGEIISFTMPEADVTVTAAFTAVQSAIAIESVEHGTVSCSGESAYTDETVTLTVDPEVHFELESLECRKAGSEETVPVTKLREDTYTFTMPGTDVLVVPKFKEILYKLEVDADLDTNRGSITFTDNDGSIITSAAYFSRVNINVVPAADYLLDNIYAKDNDGKKYAISESRGRYYISPMPAADLTVYAAFEPHQHKNLVYSKEVKADCEASGTRENWYCEECNSYFYELPATEVTKIRRADLVLSATGHDWGPWKVTKQPTATQAGEKQRVCKNNSAHVQKEKIPATGKKEEPKKKDEPKKETKKKSSEKPVLIAKASAEINKVTLSWNKIKDADRYVIYFSKCNDDHDTYKVKKIKTVKANVRKYTVSSLECGKCYKFKIVAQKKVKGKYKRITRSLLTHFIAGNESGTVTVPKNLKLNKKTVKLKAKKTFQLKGKVVLFNSDKEVLSHESVLRYTSNNPSVATVSKKGKIKAKKAGTCTIYVQTINGLCKKCKVTVK